MVNENPPYGTLSPQPTPPPPRRSAETTVCARWPPRSVVVSAKALPRPDSRGSRPPRRAATYGCSWLRRWHKTHSQQRTRPPGRPSTHSQQGAPTDPRTLSAAIDHPLTTDSVCNCNCVSSTQQIFGCILREAHDDAFGHSGHQRSSSDEEGRGREGAPPGIRRSG